MKIFLLIYVIQTGAGHPQTTVQRLEEPNTSICESEARTALRELRIDHCNYDDPSVPCFTPYFVKTACVAGS